MNPSIASLIALLLAILISMFSRLNVGLLAIALAWIVGVYVAGLKADAVMAGFPAALFITLAGVTLLFACADANGTLKRLSHACVQSVRGNRRLLPVLFFFIACAISSVGPGAISSVALVIPLAMVIGKGAGVQPFFTALMVANGANAGNLSPISALGVIANTKMAEGGLSGYEGKVWFTNFIAHLLVSAVAYFILFRRKNIDGNVDESTVVIEEQHKALTRQHWLTIGIISIWIIGVLIFKLNVGLSAFAAATLIILLQATDEVAAFKKIPWGVIVMVCGVSLLIALLEKTGGMEHFTALLAKVATPESINGVIAFITGTISTYSSTSGVVLPAFLPTATLLSTQIGGGDPLAIALSINVGSSLVDVSPLSTLGALCLATINDPGESRRLFRQLLLWGLAMTIAGALFSLFFCGLIARF